MDPIMEGLFFDVLKIDPTAVSGVFLNDFVNLLLLPTIVLVLMLELAAKMFTGNRPGLSHILSVAFYLFIITQGWYGILATFVSSYMAVSLILSIMLFFAMQFVGLGYMSRGYKHGAAVGAGLENAAQSREQKRLVKQSIEAEIRILESQISGLRNTERQLGIDLLRVRQQLVGPPAATGVTFRSLMEQERSIREQQRLGVEQYKRVLAELQNKKIELQNAQRW